MNRTKEFEERLLGHLRGRTLPPSIKETPEQLAQHVLDQDWFVSAEFVGGPVAQGGSKVGGKPDLPSDLEWPCEDGSETPLAFVAQINFEEAAPKDLLSRLPDRGILWLFCLADGDRAYGGEIDETTSRAVYLREPGPVAPRDLPEELDEDEDATIAERGLVFGPCVSLSGIQDVDVLEPITASLRELGGRRGPIHLLTSPSPPPDDVEPFDDEAMSERIVLMELDGYEVARNAFGEGILEVVLNTQALARGELSELEVCYNAGT